MLSLTTNSSTDLKIENGSLSIGAGSSTLGGPVTVEYGAILSVGATASVLIASYQTLADNGTLSFGTGDTVTFGGAATIAVNPSGTLTASGDTFTTNGSGNNYLQVYSGGELTASNSTFDLSQVSWAQGSVMKSNGSDLTGDTFNGVLAGQTFSTPLSMPYGDVQDLEMASNAAFGEIDILADTIPYGTMLTLEPIGGGSAHRYVFLDSPQQPFTVASGATLSVAANVNVLIASYQTIADNGTLSFGTGDTVTFGGAATIAVNPSGTNPAGTMAATGDTFTTNGSGNNYLQVYSGGELTASNSTFDLSQVSWAQGSVMKSNGSDLTGDTFNGVLAGQTFSTPLSMPYGDVQDLEMASNAAFGDIDILADTIPYGTMLTLEPIGGGSAIRYVFLDSPQQPFTVASGATLSVAANVNVLIASYQTIADNGTLTFGTGDTVTFGGPPRSQSIPAGPIPAGL